MIILNGTMFQFIKDYLPLHWKYSKYLALEENQNLNLFFLPLLCMHNNFLIDLLKT